MKIDLELKLEELKSGAHTRTKNSLDALHRILKKHYQSGERDYCIATIGRLSADVNGPSTVSIRNKSGAHYRELIESWAIYAGTTMKKPVSNQSRKREVPSDHKLLEHINDPALRTVFGQIIAERNRYRNQLNLLKQQTEFLIDKRPKAPSYSHSDATIEVLPALSGILSEMEKEALDVAISDEFFSNQGWLVAETGQVKCHEYGEIYKRGYVNAIRKVLDAID
jgi:hypothetical protein